MQAKAAALINVAPLRKHGQQRLISKNTQNKHSLHDERAPEPHHSYCLGTCMLCLHDMGQAVLCPTRSPHDCIPL